MRLISKLGIVYKIVFIEAAILFLIGAIFYSQFSNERADVVNKTVMASELIGDEAAQFAVHNSNPTSMEFYSFLRSKHGQGGVFKTFNVVPSSFQVVFTREVGKAGWEGLYSERGYGVVDKAGMFSVSAPFLIGADGVPYGVVTVNSSKTLIMRKVFKDNFLLYFALFLVLNNQVFILHYFAAKRQQNIIEKGYLRPYMKQHSIGALKVMRKILEEIIEDHPQEVKKAPEAGTRETGKSGSKKVISFSQFLSRNS